MNSQETRAELPSVPTDGEYVVQAGDTLIAIAKRFGVELIDLMNRNAISDARLLRAGQRLIVPNVPSMLAAVELPPPPVTPSSMPTPDPRQANPANGPIYVVRAGDTMQGIAQRFNVTVEALVAANNLPDEKTMRVGQQMIIPNSSFVLRVAGAAADQNAQRSGVGVLGVGDPTTPVVTPQEIQSYLAGKRTTYYITRAGDTITRVASMFHMDALVLAQINQVSIAGELAVETRLIIPMK